MKKNWNLADLEKLLQTSPFCSPRCGAEWLLSESGTYAIAKLYHFAPSLVGGWTNFPEFHQLKESFRRDNTPNIDVVVIRNLNLEIPDELERSFCYDHLISHFEQKLKVTKLPLPITNSCRDYICTHRRCELSWIQKVAPNRYVISLNLNRSSGHSQVPLVFGVRGQSTLLLKI